MKHLFFIMTMLIVTFNTSLSQQTKARDKYIINPLKPGQGKVYFKIKSKIDTLKKGWVITEIIAGNTIQRVLANDSLVTTMIDSAVVFKRKWVATEIVHSDSDPSKLVLNPWTFRNSEQNNLNTKAYIKIPANSYIRLKHNYFQFSAVAIPIALRPALNDSIKSKITTNVNLGISFSYNMTWEKFRNRRIKASKSSHGFSFGIGSGFSSVSLDKNNTSLDDEPLEDSEDGLALFFAPGIGFNTRGIHLVVFWAHDFAITGNVKKWNYNAEMYWGLGLGINLNTLGKFN